MKKLFILAAIVAIAVSCGNKKPAPEPAAPAEQAAEAVQEAVQAFADEQAIEMIREFYANYVFGEETMDADVAAKYCTESLAQFLLDDNDYDVECYAVWDFSKSEAGDNFCEGVETVEPLGGGKYKVSFTENDVKKSVTLTLVADGDKILFDKID
jgi:hypothetical protein